MDNASIHSIGDEILHQIREEYGVVIMYQAPYSPDLNPIELVFAYIKAEMKKFQLSWESLSSILFTIFAKITPDLLQAFILHCKRKWIVEDKSWE